MTSEIRQRIDQIRQGEVPEGYKKTRIGTIPAEWDAIRFGRLFKRINRRNADGDTNVLTISAQHGLIRQGEFFNKAIAGEDKTNYYLLRRGEYAYNKSYSKGYPLGAVKRLEQYEQGIVSPLYICFSTTEENKCPEFYSQYFEAGGLNAEIQSFAQEGARNHGLLNISVDDFFNITLVRPPQEEQQKIACILATQDKAIELQQRKVEELKNLKKVFLSKMFPKKDCRTPELRFKGFTGDWEQRKFSEITYPVGIKNRDNLPFESYSITNESGFVPQDEKFENGGTMREADKRMYYIVPPQSFAYNPARINVGSIGYQNLDKNVIVSSLYEVFKTIDMVDDRFLWHWFKSNDFQKLIEQLQEGGVRLYFYYDKLCMGAVAIPSKEEQKRIGEFLDQLDDLITLHQHKLSEMERMKKTLMQLLLTGIVRVTE